MGGVDLAGVRDQVKAGDDDLAVPDDGLAGLVQLAMEAVGVRALGDAGDLSFGPKL